MHAHYSKQAGMTLVELVMSIVIVGIVVGGVMATVSTAILYSVDPALQEQAVFIANTYMEEIIGKSFADPDTGTPCSSVEASRDLYDDVCDYNGLVNASGAIDQEGNPIAGLSNYRIDVSVGTDSLNGISGATNVLRIDVRVRFMAGANEKVDFTLSSYKARAFS